MLISRAAGRDDARSVRRRRQVAQVAADVGACRNELQRGACHVIDEQRRGAETGIGGLHLATGGCGDNRLVERPARDVGKHRAGRRVDHTETAVRAGSPIGVARVAVHDPGPHDGDVARAGSGRQRNRLHHGKSRRVDADQCVRNRWPCSWSTTTWTNDVIDSAVGGAAAAGPAVRGTRDAATTAGTSRRAGIHMKEASQRAARVKHRPNGRSSWLSTKIGFVRSLRQVPFVRVNDAGPGASVARSGAPAPSAAQGPDSATPRRTWGRRPRSTAAAPARSPRVFSPRSSTT